MVAAPTLVNATGQKKIYFASDCNRNEGFILFSLLLEFISAPNSFKESFCDLCFQEESFWKALKVYYFFKH